MQAIGFPSSNHFKNCMQTEGDLDSLQGNHFSIGTVADASHLYEFRTTTECSFTSPNYVFSPNAETYLSLVIILNKTDVPASINELHISCPGRMMGSELSSYQKKTIVLHALHVHLSFWCTFFVVFAKVTFNEMIILQVSSTPKALDGNFPVVAIILFPFIPVKFWSVRAHLTFGTNWNNLFGAK